MHSNMNDVAYQEKCHGQRRIEQIWNARSHIRHGNVCDVLHFRNLVHTMRAIAHELAYTIISTTLMRPHTTSEVIWQFCSCAILPYNLLAQLNCRCLYLSALGNQIQRATGDQPTLPTKGSTQAATQTGSTNLKYAPDGQSPRGTRQTRTCMQACLPPDPTRPPCTQEGLRPSGGGYKCDW